MVLHEGTSKRGIPETTIAAVVGHKRQGETFDTYSAGPSMEQFRASVEAVEAALDVDGEVDGECGLFLELG